MTRGEATNASQASREPMVTSPRSSAGGEPKTGNPVTMGSLSVRAALIIPLLVAVLAYYVILSRQAWPISTTIASTGKVEVLQPIPVSQVLSHALRLAESTDPSSSVTSRPKDADKSTDYISRFTLSYFAQSLLNVQNPELTPFAGAGHGFTLRDPAPGARLEVFPKGRLPRAIGGSGRYDEWSRVKGLRWLVGKIDTISGAEGGGVFRDMPVDGHEDQIIDEALLAWPLLLLEAAGVEDVNNPMPVGRGRNAFAEVVDRLWKDMQDHHRVAYLASCLGSRRLHFEGNATMILARVSNAGPEIVPEMALTVPAFLATYAVGKQDLEIMQEAEATLWTYECLLSLCHDETSGQPIPRSARRSYCSWKSMAGYTKDTQHTNSDEMSRTADGPGSTFGTDRIPSQWRASAWVLSGFVHFRRIRGSWDPKISGLEVDEELFQQSKKLSLEKLDATIKEILGSLAMLHAEHNSDIESGDHVSGETMADSPTRSGISTHDLTATSLTAAAIYRIAVMMPRPHNEHLPLADYLWNTVAHTIRAGGGVDIMQDAVKLDRNEQLLLQSVLLDMWAARRDCVKLGGCVAGMHERLRASVR